MPPLSVSRGLHALAVLSALLAGTASARAVPDRNLWGGSQGDSNDSRWVTTWTSMPQLVEPGNLPPAPYNVNGSEFVDSTLRQTLHISLGASKTRLRFSNVFGTIDLPITAATVALPFNGSAGVSAIQSQTLQKVTFSGNESIIVPNGAVVVSDPIDLPVMAQSMISVSLYLKNGQQSNFITGHPGSRTTSYFAGGNQVNEANLTGAASAAHWYFVSAVDAWVNSNAKAFVIVGDSITDGRGSETDKNNRWPDLVLAKMQKNYTTSNIAVVNQAAGGNRILADGLGPNALGRIERDVLAQAHVGWAMIFEGVNDIGTAANTTAAQAAVGDRLIQAYEQIITRTHAAGIPLFGATITPFGKANGSSLNAYTDPAREQTRQRVNLWIRESGKFDAVVDFDEIVRDPANPVQLLPAYDSGDSLHPNVKGYQAMADAFPLDVFGIDGADEYV